MIEGIRGLTKKPHYAIMLLLYHNEVPSEDHAAADWEQYGINIHRYADVCP